MTASAGAAADPLFVAVDPATVRPRASGENFPVALRVLPRALRSDLLAIYDVARLLDELGDAAEGDRLALLDAAEAELHAAFEDRARHPVMRALTPTLRRRRLPRGPFLRLVEANRRDQRHPVMASWEELVDYCRFSANPVGELVLHCLGRADAASVALSDRVCTALQVVEHCQDVAEDAAAGRVYLPGDDLARFGCERAALTSTPAPSALRRVVALQVGRARELLGAGETLVARQRGFGRPLIAAFVAGGRATCAALERAGGDPNLAPVRPRKRDVARSALALLARASVASVGETSAA